MKAKTIFSRVAVLAGFFSGRTPGGTPALPEGYCWQQEQRNLTGPDPVVEAAAKIEKVRGSLGKFVLALNAMTLPEALKPAVKSMTDEMNGLLEKLPPLDAHKAATEANYALNSLSYAMTSCQDAMERCSQLVSKMSVDCMTALNAKDTSVNGLVQTEVEKEITKRLESGALIKKETSDGLLQAARNQGRDTALNSIRVIAERKTKLADLKLPWPAKDEVLEGDDAAFTALTTTAASRVTTLKGKEITLNNAPDLVRDLIYSKSFDTELPMIEKALAAAKGIKPGTEKPGTPEKRILL